MNFTNKIKLLTFLFICFALNSDFFPQNKKYSIAAKLNYTTDAKVFLYPNASDYVIRNTAFPIEGFLNYSFEGKYYVGSNIVAALNLEFIEATKTGANLVVFENSRTVIVNVEDGFYLVPVELSLHYILPFSSEIVKFSFFGGLGLYYGEPVRKLMNIEVESISKKIDYGILIGCEFNVHIMNNIFLTAGMKFRDPELTVKGKYTSRETQYNGKTYLIPQEHIETRINMDGITFNTGIGIAF